jgi:hypothetical protein
VILGSDLIDIRRIEKSIERYGDRFIEPNPCVALGYRIACGKRNCPAHGSADER